MKKRKPDPEAIKKLRKGHGGGRYHELRLMAREAEPQQTVQEKRAYYVSLLQELARRNLIQIERKDSYVWRVWHPLRPERVAFWTSGSGKWLIPARVEQRVITEKKRKGRYLSRLLDELGVKVSKGRSIEAWLSDLDHEKRRRER